MHHAKLNLNERCGDEHTSIGNETMKTCYYYFLYGCLRFALWLRNRLHVKGWKSVRLNL